MFPICTEFFPTMHLICLEDVPIGFPKCIIQIPNMFKNVCNMSSRCPQKFPLMSKMNSRCPMYMRAPNEMRLGLFDCQLDPGVSGDDSISKQERTRP